MKTRKAPEVASTRGALDSSPGFASRVRKAGITAIPALLATEDGALWFARRRGLRPPVAFPDATLRSAADTAMRFSVQFMTLLLPGHRERGGQLDWSPRPLRARSGQAFKSLSGCQSALPYWRVAGCARCNKIIANRRMSLSARRITRAPLKGRAGAMRAVRASHSGKPTEGVMGLRFNGFPPWKARTAMCSTPQMSKAVEGGRLGGITG